MPYFATPVMGVGAEDKGLRWDGMAKAVEAGRPPTGRRTPGERVREAVELIAALGRAVLVGPMPARRAGRIRRLRGGRPPALVKSLAADRDASEGQPNGIGSLRARAKRPRRCAGAHRRRRGLRGRGEGRPRGPYWREHAVGEGRLEHRVRTSPRARPHRPRRRGSGALPGTCWREGPKGRLRRRPVQGAGR